ncbi:MAG TPA: glycosyltransferase [Acidimicrobiales bacterium]|nr:glycosyltransferase [Acidimicrobiales bacterium]
MSASPLAYVLWKFPKLSETFVLEELRALERLGIVPEILALEHPREQAEHGDAARLSARAQWTEELTGRQWADVMLWLTVHPRAVGRTLAAALRCRSRRTLRNLRPAFAVAAMAARSGIEYLHAHFADEAGEVAWLAATATGIPYGVTVHAVDIYVNRRSVPFVLAQASLVVTVCRYNVEQLVQRYPFLERSAILVKPAGVDTAFFATRERHDPPVPGRVVAVGRLVDKKGFDVLVQAVAELRRQGTDATCTIVGDGPRHKDLHDTVVRLGVEEAVRLAGPLPPDEVRRLLATAWVVAAPCTIAADGDRDSMPVVLKEAMAMEVPVVASDDFGIPELVTPDAGALVPRDDAAALADALGSVLALSAEARAAMGRAGRQVVEERFREDLVVQPLAAAFASLVPSLEGALRATTG